MKNLRIKISALIVPKHFYLVLFFVCSIKALPEAEKSRVNYAGTSHESETAARPIAESHSKAIAPFTLSDQLMKGYGHDSFIELPPKKLSNTSRAADGAAYKQRIDSQSGANSVAARLFTEVTVIQSDHFTALQLSRFRLSA